MSKQEFLNELETILEAEPGSVHGTDPLMDLEGWDSLAMLSTIAMIDEKLGLNVSAKKLDDCKTVDDLIALLGDKISG